jgi:hypothetical protein
VVSPQRNSFRPAGTKKESIRPKAPNGPGNLVVGLTIIATMLAVLIAMEFLTPVLLAAPVIPFFYRCMKNGDRRTAFGLALRWGLTVFITVALIGGFNSERTEKAVPLSDQYQTAVQKWIAMSDVPPPGDYTQLAGALLIFAAAVLFSGGLGGFVVGALGLASLAYGAAYLFQNGDNIFHVLIIAVPLWLSCLVVACLFLLVPLAEPFYQRLVGERDSSGGPDLRRYVFLGLGFVLAGILLRLTLSGLWLELTQRWTIS